jgi:hypothetical protein
LLATALRNTRDMPDDKTDTAKDQHELIGVSADQGETQQM